MVTASECTLTGNYYEDVGEKSAHEHRQSHQSSNCGEYNLATETDANVGDWRFFVLQRFLGCRAALRAEVASKVELNPRGQNQRDTVFSSNVTTNVNPLPHTPTQYLYANMVAYTLTLSHTC